MPSHADASLDDLAGRSPSRTASMCVDQHEHGRPPVFSSTECKHVGRWHFDGSGRLVSPQGMRYAIAASIIECQSDDAFDDPARQCCGQRTETAVAAAQPECNNTSVTTVSSGGSGGRSPSPPHTTLSSSHAQRQHLHQHQRQQHSQRKRRPRHHHSSKKAKESNSSPTRTTTAPPPPCAVAGQLTTRLRSLSLSTSSTSSVMSNDVGPATCSSATAAAPGTGSKPVAVAGGNGSNTDEEQDGGCGIENRVHSERGGSHESAGTQAPPTKSSSNPEKKQRLYKTELCRNWEELQTCRYGDKCQYAHGLDDLRNVERHPKYKTQVCRTYYQTGTCPYGTRCTFRHQEDDDETPQPYRSHRRPSTCSATATGASISCSFVLPEWMSASVSMPLVATASAAPHPPHPPMPTPDLTLPSDAESLLPTGLLSDLDEPPPPPSAAVLLPCIPSRLLFDHHTAPLPTTFNIWKRHPSSTSTGAAAINGGCTTATTL